MTQNNEAMKILPSKFWMKSLGGPVGNKDGPKGRWITTLMYTEDSEMDNAFQRGLETLANKRTTNKYRTSKEITRSNSN